MAKDFQELTALREALRSSSHLAELSAGGLLLTPASVIQRISIDSAGELSTAQGSQELTALRVALRRDYCNTEPLHGIRDALILPAWWSRRSRTGGVGAVGGAAKQQPPNRAQL